MSDYLRRYQATMKVANIMMINEPNAYNLGVLRKETGNNYAPLATAQGVLPAAAGGAATGAALSAITGSTPVGHLRTLARDGAPAVKDNVVNHLKNFNPQKAGKAALRGGLGAAALAGGITATGNAINYATGKTLAPRYQKPWERWME